jgi:hypothetical protein
MISKKPHLSHPLQITPNLKLFNTRIQSADDLSHQPLVTISDNDNSELVLNINIYIIVK